MLFPHEIAVLSSWKLDTRSEVYRMQRIAFSKFLLISAFLSAGFIGTAAQAQGVPPDSIVSALQPENHGEMVRTLKAQNALTLPRDQQIPPAFSFASMQFNVDFQPGSALLTASGMTTLRSIAVAIMDSRLDGQVFQVAGHVFAEDNVASALPLSAKRARAVAEHLKAFYEIPNTRLVPVGYGGNNPVDASNPYSPVNTRIEIINVTGL